jgi:TRAP-type C4-dicarboxylate transport system permease large subunit
MSAVVITAMIGSAFAGAALLASAIGFMHLPQIVSEAITALNLTPLMLLLALTAAYILLGCVLDGISMILMTAPITLPLFIANGFDPVWVGVYLVLMVEVGMVTPPIGFNLFVLRGITGVPIGRIALATLPFFLLMLLGGALLVVFPQIALWLPSTLR